jgi:hypothetical protein
MNAYDISNFTFDQVRPRHVLYPWLSGASAKKANVPPSPPIARALMLSTLTALFLLQTQVPYREIRDFLFVLAKRCSGHFGSLRKNFDFSFSLFFVGTSSVLN